MKRYWFYIILFLAAEAVITASIYSYKEQRIAEYIRHSSESNTLNLRSMQNTYKIMYTDVYKDVLNTPVVKEYVSGAYSDIMNRGALRNSLYSYLLPAFRSLKATNLENIHFHFPDITSFLRMKDPASYGDDLTTERSLVLITNEKNQFTEGFEKGLRSTGYRFVFPLNSETEHLGSVEFIIDIDGFVNALNTLYGGSYKFIFTEKEITAAHKHKTEPYKIAEHFYADSCTACSYTQESTLISDDINRLLRRDFEKEIHKRITAASPSSLLADYEGEKYVITFTPIRELKGEYIGAIIGYEKADFYDKLINYTLMMYALLSVVAASVVVAIALLDNARKRTIRQKEKLEQIVEEKVRELRDREQFYAQQAKMVTMGEMLAAILHQWKQPISSISLLTDMLIFDCEDKQCSLDMKKHLQEIKSQTLFMAQTDKDFRNFLKPGAKPELFNVCDAVVEVLRLFDFSFARYNISFQTYWTEDTEAKALVKGYPNEFKHILLNLFNNSRDAITSKRDRIIDSGQDVSQFKGIIKISIDINGKNLIIRVSDSGGGISDNIIDMIFNQYFSTKRENGSGIGLYMTKNLVETNMNGQISVKNIEEGAEFTIKCPLSAKE